MMVSCMSSPSPHPCSKDPRVLELTVIRAKCSFPDTNVLKLYSPDSGDPVKVWVQFKVMAFGKINEEEMVMLN